MNTKICKKCGLDKCLSEFNIRKTKIGTIYYRSMCKMCQKESKKIYYEQHAAAIRSKVNKYRIDNDSIIKSKKKEYYNINKEQILKKYKEYYFDNNEKISEKKKEFYRKNKDIINKRKLGYQKNRERSNPIFKLRRRVSNMVYSMIKKNGKCKNGLSILAKLPYSIDELKLHLEVQFENWMTWNNWGKYNALTWNDNDQTTWTWQIDHIIPHSEFQYTTMEDEKFKSCWSLSNLRPLSSKQNWIDGTYRNRHLNRG